MDLDLAPIWAKLASLTSITNLEGIFLVNRGKQEVLYSELQPVNSTLLTVSGHLYNNSDGNPKTVQQEDFDATFNPLFNDHENFSTQKMEFMQDGVQKEMLI